MAPKDSSPPDAPAQPFGRTRYTRRIERSVTLAKEVAQKLDVDLFDDHRRGKFRTIVQNCSVCPYQKDCRAQVMGVDRLAAPLSQCRNRDLFAQGN